MAVQKYKNRMMQSGSSGIYFSEYGITIYVDQFELREVKKKLASAKDRDQALEILSQYKEPSHD